MPDEAPLPNGKKFWNWKTLLNLALLVVLVGVFAWQFKKSWPQIVNYDWHHHWNWELAALAIVLLLACSLIDVFIWNRTLSWFTDPLPYWTAAPVYIWSSLARYIPFKVASLFIRVALATEADRKPVPVLACSTVELALRTASALLLFIITILGWGAYLDARMRTATLVVLPLVLICAHPKVMMPIINWLLKKIKQEPVSHRLRYREVLGIFLVLFARWIVYGLAYSFLAGALYSPALGHLPVLAGLASGSWAAGFILMTPGGLGASEGIQQVLLTQMGFPVAITTILPVVARVITLFTEGLWSLAAIPIWARQTRAVKPVQMPVENSVVE